MSNFVWELRNAIMVAVPVEPSQPVEPIVEQPVVPSGVHELIACGKCFARVDECCRSKTGHKVLPHRDRYAPRLCSCGELPEPGHAYCEPCARAKLQQSKNEHGARRRAAEKRAS